MPRKVPYSGKKKRLQLQNKRKRKAGALVSDVEKVEVQKIDLQPGGDEKSLANRYALKFFNETEEELQRRAVLASQTVVPVDKEQLEINAHVYFLPEVDFPKRSPWNYEIEMSKEQLEAQENHYFTEYVKSLIHNFKKEEEEQPNYFEFNLENRRQLSRVIEKSDVILFIVDVRFSALMFPSSLMYSYVVHSLGKKMILVLNKADLVPAELAVAWKHYFLSKFSDIHVVIFTSYPVYNLHGNLESTSKRRRMQMAVEGAEKIYDMCHKIFKTQVDLSSWRKKIMEEKMSECGETIKTEAVDTSCQEHVKDRDRVLTIGCLGQPNAGKSSVINALMGKKVVSVSKIPGHTKRFQTIFITPKVKLCDCPSLVFPSEAPKVLQILMGCFPIAHLREPHTTVKYMAERLDLVRLLRLQKLMGDGKEMSAMDICDGWAKRKGFYTARTGRPDTSRAANHLLRLALDGNICLCLRPPGYAQNEDAWRNHADMEEISWIYQARNKSDSAAKCPCSFLRMTKRTRTNAKKRVKTRRAEMIWTKNWTTTTPEMKPLTPKYQRSNKFALLTEED